MCYVKLLLNLWNNIYSLDPVTYAPQASGSTIKTEKEQSMYEMFYSLFNLHKPRLHNTLSPQTIKMYYFTVNKCTFCSWTQTFVIRLL